MFYSLHYLNWVVKKTINWKNLELDNLGLKPAISETLKKNLEFLTILTYLIVKFSFDSINFLSS